MTRRERRVEREFQVRRDSDSQVVAQCSTHRKAIVRFKDMRQGHRPSLCEMPHALKGPLVPSPAWNTLGFNPASGGLTRRHVMRGVQKVR